MSFETLPTNEWIENNRLAFTEANTLAEQIDRQHTAYSMLVNVDQDSSVENGSNAITDRLSKVQQSTFNELKFAEVKAPYDELARRESDLRHGIEVIEKSVGILGDFVKNSASFTKAENEIFAKFLPEKSEHLSATVVDIIKTKIELIKSQAELQAEYVELEKLYKEAGEAWPIPRLLGKAAVVTEVAEQPVRSEKSESVEKRGYRKDTSKSFVELLTREPGRIFTLDEVGAALYEDDTDDITKGRRIHSTINQYVQGKSKKLGEVLDESGVALQKTKVINEKGRIIVLYRAVPVDYIEKESELEWTAVEPLAAKIGGLAVESAVVVEEATIEEPTQATEVEAATSSTSLHLEIEENVTEGDSSEDLAAVIDIRESKKSKELKWMPEFRSAVKEAIDQLKEDHLMDEETLSFNLANRKSSSGIMGTLTMISRAVSNGIITKEQSDFRNRDEKLPISVFVLMKLQNSFHRIFELPTAQRKQAEAVVNQLIAEFFEEQKLKKTK